MYSSYNISHSIAFPLLQNANKVHNMSKVIVSVEIYSAKYASLEKMVVLSVQFNPRI